MATSNSTLSKICSKCLQNKSFTHYGKRTAAKDGLKSSCKECRKIESFNYYLAFLPKIKEKAFKQRAANPEKNNARAALWLKENALKAKATKKIYRSENFKRLNAGTTTWKKNNPEKVRIYVANRRAAKLSGGKLSPDLSLQLFESQKGLCACGCGVDLRQGFHLDHIQPLSLGGANQDANCQLLTPRCNLSKGAMPALEWYRQITAVEAAAIGAHGRAE